MSRLGLSALVTCFIATCGSNAVAAELLGGVDAKTFGDVTYTEIQGVELKTFPRLMSYPYEVRIPNTPFRKMILCLLKDANGEVVSKSLKSAGNGETRIFFGEKAPNLTAQCYYAEAERLTRP